MTVPTDAEVAEKRQTSYRFRAILLVGGSALILVSHGVDVVQAGGPAWEALALRGAWVVLLVVCAAALRWGSGFAIRVTSTAAGLGTSLLFLALLNVTGGSASPLFSFTYVLVMLLPPLMTELYGVALLGSMLLLGGSWALLYRDGVPRATLYGWVHIGAATLVLAWLLGLALRRTIGAAERLARERKQALEVNEKLVSELRQALNSVKALSGLLPICAFCKKIRNDLGYWEQLEAYVSAHSEAEFSHGLCPECLTREYPGVPGAGGG